MLGGLPCPRQPSERDSKGAVHLEDGKDVSIFFLRGAQSTLNICKNYGIEIALLKSKSPSCGFGYIYDGNFTGHLRKGNGVTASFLDENGIEIINEHELESWLNKLKE